MATNSNIEWTDHTLNLWWGCSKVHEGCKHCYAESLANRFGTEWGEGVKRKGIKGAFKELEKMQRKAAKANERHRVFVGSMMDIFEDNKELQEPIVIGLRQCVTTGQLRDQFFENICAGRYPNLTFLLLTKRPENIRKYGPNYGNFKNADDISNLWFGTSISSSKTAKYAEVLKDQTHGLPRFLSIEPQVGEIKPNDLDLSGIDWVIQGGESAKGKHRPFEIEWAYTMRDHCKVNNIPYFFKQIDKVQEIPEDLQIREFPEF